MRKGFTLIEVLIVMLCMTCLLFFIPRINVSHFQKMQQFHLYLENLSHHLLKAQTQAIMYEKAIQITFSKQQEAVVIKTETEVTRYPLPKPFHFATYFQFYYLSNGHTDRFKSIHVVDLESNNRYIINFQLGSGRFEIQS